MGEGGLRHMARARRDAPLRRILHYIFKQRTQKSVQGEACLAPTKTGVRVGARHASPYVLTSSRVSFRNVLTLLIFTFCLTACEQAAVFVPTPTPIPSLDTAWGRSQALTWAATFDPPALATDGTSALLGAFEPFENAPTLVVYRDGVRARSNVIGNRPYSLTVFPAGDGFLALWLDDDGSGVQMLYASRLRGNGFAEFGAIAVSNGAVTRYAAAAMPDSSVWAVWSSPITGEAALIGSRIDSEGRPRASQPLRADADYPALAVTNAGNALLYWLDGNRLDLYRAELTDAGLTQTREIRAAPWPHTAADQLIRLDAGLDLDIVYVFWQVRNGLGPTEVWTLSAPIDGTSDAAAHRLTLAMTADTAQTGFNHGVAYAASEDASGSPVAWAQPARGQNETLPVAAVLDGAIGVVYFRGGAVIAAQTLASLDGGLVAPPRVAADADRDLVVAWWMPDTLDEAILYVVDSER